MDFFKKALEFLDKNRAGINKLFDLLSSAIGKLYEPANIKRIGTANAKRITTEADAEAYRITVISDAVRQNEDIPIVYNSSDGNVSIDNSLAARANYRLSSQEIRKQENIESIIEQTCELLDNDDHVSDEAIDMDWFDRFIDSVGYIGDKELQYIWAKILAGEVKQPGSYSFRTLRVLKDLSPKEAVLFTKTYPINLKGCIINDNELFKKHNITYTDILTLADSGLISSKDSERTFTIEKEPIAIVTTSDYLLLAEPLIESVQSFSYKVYVLTEAGNTIYNLVNPQMTIEDVYDFAKSIKRNNKKPNIKISLHKFDPIKSQYEVDDLLID